MKLSIMLKHDNCTGKIITYFELCDYLKSFNFKIYKVETLKNRVQIHLIEINGVDSIYINFFEEK